MKLIERYSTSNDCYKNNLVVRDKRYADFQKNGPKKLMLHSVGCPQPNAEVFAKLWDKAGYEIAVHAVLQADGVVYQCLPWNFRGWHCGGSGNDIAVGVEMTEPDCIKYTRGSEFTCSDYDKARAQVRGTYKTAVELFAYLCNKYDLDPLRDILSHKEGHSQGIASGHSDPEHLWTGLNLPYTMDTFRADVKEALSVYKAPPEAKQETGDLYRVRRSWADKASQIGAYKVLENAKAVVDANPGYGVYNSAGTLVYPVSFQVRVKVSNLRIRKGPGTGYISAGFIVPGVYTIVETKVSGGYTWGRLKSGAGWIALEYATRL